MVGWLSLMDTSSCEPEALAKPIGVNPDEWPRVLA
jgi:hypothetical protein